MTNPNRRHLAVILDRSGSMQSVKADTEGGLRAFLATQAEAPGETTVSLYQFDDKYDVVYEDVPLGEVPEFVLEPRGMTALLDAVGRTVATVGGRLAAVAEAERPGEVVVVILTDGEENASKEYTLARVKEMITVQQEQYQWVFVFLGADQDAFAAAGGMGIAASTTLSYSGKLTTRSMKSAGRMVSRGRASGVYGFTGAERDESS